MMRHLLRRAVEVAALRMLGQAEILRLRAENAALRRRAEDAEAEAALWRARYEEMADSARAVIGWRRAMAGYRRRGEPGVQA